MLTSDNYQKYLIRWQRYFSGEQSGIYLYFGNDGARAERYKLQRLSETTYNAKSEQLEKLYDAYWEGVNDFTKAGQVKQVEKQCLPIEIEMLLYERGKKA